MSLPLVTGVILAGGASSRMGVDKAEVQIRGVRMLDHMRDILKHAGINHINVLGRPSEPGGIPDTEPHTGPAIGLWHYLRIQPENSRHLIVPVDMPNLDTAIINQLIEQRQWAYYNQNPLPLLAIASSETTTDRPLTIRALLQAHNAISLPLPESAKTVFANINTVSDLAKWQ
ncbi:molybdenum cofactor guanylyltransferase [Kordiimonas pumila]|uniref:Molybdenum cofactor guanylyltransferase n=1 Tax=Kordiimonas pumila TaxID=2161677 RepID=A0ABV7D9K1_9PROT|nr:molybdenum cofactor guanylyltransferase [Kordiimonas pumila]